MVARSAGFFRSGRADRPLDRSRRMRWSDAEVCEVTIDRDRPGSRRGLGADRRSPRVRVDLPGGS